MKLYPLLVASPLSIDLEGGPISYESYAFSPRKASASLLSPIRNPCEAFPLLFHLLMQSRIGCNMSVRGVDARGIRLSFPFFRLKIIGENKLKIA